MTGAIDDLADELGVAPVRADELMGDSVGDELEQIRAVLEDRLGDTVTVHHRMVTVVGEDNVGVENRTLRIVLRESGQMRDDLPEFVEAIVERLGFELARTRRVIPSLASREVMDEDELVEEREYHVVTWDEDQMAKYDQHRRPSNQISEFPLSSQNS